MFTIDNPIVKMALTQFTNKARKDGIRHILVSIPDGEGAPTFDSFTEPGKFMTDTEILTIKKFIENAGSNNNNSNDKPGNPEPTTDSNNTGESGGS